MRSSTSSSDPPVPSAFPRALVAALLLFVASEHFLWSWRPWLEFCARYVPPYRASDPLRTAVRTALLPRRATLPPIVLIGSSQIFEGLECDPFEARFPGRTCVNLGIAGGSPLDLLFLRDRLDERTRGRTLVTGLFPQTLHRDPKAAFSDASTLRCLYRTGALFRMTPAELIDNVFFGQMQSFSETLRAKDSLLDMWDVVGEDPLAALRYDLPPPPPRTLDQRPPRERGVLRSLMGIVDPTIAPGRFTAAHESALEEVIAGEVQRGNQMVIIDFPTRRGYETTITPEAVEHHRRLMTRLASRGGVWVVASGDLPPLHDEDFHDFTHLRPSGRRKVSERIAAIVTRIGG
jgi:hypothetical protein